MLINALYNTLHHYAHMLYSLQKMNIHTGLFIHNGHIVNLKLMDSWIDFNHFLIETIYF